MKVAILQMEGTNCEEESYMAFKEIGAEPEYLHLNLLRPGMLEDYDMLFIPGGFSSGDYVRAGAIFAARLKAKAWNELRKFVEAEKPVMGVCNGFQVLIELGLLPGTDGISDVPEAALATNESNRFECRWVHLKKERDSIFSANVPDRIVLPVAHAEGRFIASPRVIEEMEAQRQVVFRYIAPDGSKPDYPWNPNGSINDIAAVVNSYGNVFGIMPHPERAFFWYQHPDWTRIPRNRGDGYYVFESLMRIIEAKNR
ncbi:MAG: phosphoribosylformylglycinamidine synthase subunit PurQ [Euryarchaeota archaeon]|nr:phosphoribosylformylglycinamidine synthase subunit PurQ [Euryarchaeota archaeon]